MAIDRLVKRCAIYTRKSSEEGLEQDFNSLHAQREACEAYIASQKSEGWKLITNAYDDGGISGGTMQRPALQRLLTDIVSGQVDVIVVYKVDRLTRSLTDFAKMVEVFDKHSVSFVAVTQHFNTTTSMGRLTLNVLLSFAQFEREVTGERIRDKIAASKKKGMWMGGPVPLGYRTEDKKLIIEPAEAERVHQIFTHYLNCSGVNQLVRTLKSAGIRSKNRADKPSTTFGKGALYKILSNPIYIGQVSHKGQLNPGQHEAILDQDLWDAVQLKMASNAVRSGAERISEPSRFLGKILDEAGKALSPSHAVKQGRRYRYYISHTDNEGISTSGWRLPAAELEKKVEQIIRESLNDRPKIVGAALAAGVTETAIPRLLAEISNAAVELAWVQAIHLQPDSLRVVFQIPGPKSVLMDVTVPMQMKRRGVEHRLIINSVSTPSKSDPSLIKVIGRAMRWWEMLKTGKAKSVKEVGEMDGVSAGYVSALLPYALLSPDIVKAIINGTQPLELTARSLMYEQSLPLDWSEQRKVLGFS